MPSVSRRSAEGTNRQLEWIPLDKLHADARIQRSLNLNWCEARKEKLDLDLLGTFVVWRSGRTNVLIDGMHRKKLLELAGFGDYAVPCMVLRNKSLAEASRAFNGLNDHRRVDYLTLFKNRVNYEDPAAVAIVGIVTELGLKVSGGAIPTYIQAARALDRIYSHGSSTHPKALYSALFTIREAWNLAPDSFYSSIIEGLGLMYIRYGTALERDEFIPKLAKNGTPGKLIGMARSWRDAHGGSMAMAVAGVCTSLYNKGRRVGKVDSWR